MIVKQAAQGYGVTFDGAVDGNVWNDWAGLQLVGAQAPAAGAAAGRGVGSLHGSEGADGRAHARTDTQIM